jgi:hypothetical protein
MKVTKQTSEYTIYARNDGRYAVRGKDKKYVNGIEKIKILAAEGLVRTPAPKPEQGPNAATPSDEAPPPDSAE